MVECVCPSPASPPSKHPQDDTGMTGSLQVPEGALCCARLWGGRAILFAESCARSLRGRRPGQADGRMVGWSERPTAGGGHRQRQGREPGQHAGGPACSLLPSEAQRRNFLRLPMGPASAFSNVQGVDML